MVNLDRADRAVFDAGRAAYRAGERARSCPYNAAQERLRELWVRGWVRAQAAHLYGADEVPPSDAQVKAMDRWRTGGKPRAH